MRTMIMQQMVKYMIGKCVSLLTTYLCYDTDSSEIVIVSDFQHWFPNWSVPTCSDVKNIDTYR